MCLIYYFHLIILPYEDETKNWKSIKKNVGFCLTGKEYGRWLKGQKFYLANITYSLPQKLDCYI